MALPLVPPGELRWTTFRDFRHRLTYAPRDGDALISQPSRSPARLHLHPCHRLAIPCLAGQGLRIIEHHHVAVIGGENHRRVFPATIGFDPIDDHLKRIVGVEHRTNCIVNVVVVIRPINVAGFDH